MDASRTIVEVDNSTIGLTSDVLGIKNGGITETQLASSVAGNGLSGGAGSALSVNVDGSTIETNADTLRVKAGGIFDSHVNSGAGISRSKLDINSGSNLYTSTLKTITSVTPSYTNLDSGTVVVSYSAYKYKIMLCTYLSGSSGYIKLTRATSAGNSYVEIKTTVGSTSMITRVGCYLPVGGEAYFPLNMILMNSNLADTAIVASTTTITLAATVSDSYTTADFIYSAGVILNT